MAKNVLKIGVGLAALASFAAMSVPAAAQTGAAADAARDNQEIVVTGARQRAESVQEAPIAVGVINSQQIERLHDTDIRALSAVVPNLTVHRVGPLAGAAAVSIRGFVSANNDPSIEPGVAVFVDNVYQVINAGSMVDIGDLERVEVLRGPQGSLVGKNAGAGAIMFTRRRPSQDLGGNVQVDYGTHNYVRAQGLVNFPIVDRVLAGQLVGGYEYRDDYFENIGPGADVGGADRNAIRGALLFTPTPDFSFYITADDRNDRSAQAGGRNVAAPNSLLCLSYSICAPDAGLYQQTRANYTTPTRIDEQSITAHTNWTLGPVRLTAISGYRNYDADIHMDLDHTELPLVEVHQNFVMDQYSQEVRLSSVDGAGWDLGGRADWVVGLYYGNSNVDQLQHQRAFGASLTQAQRVNRLGYAAFAHVDYAFTDALSASLGVRYSWDKTKHDYSLPLAGTTFETVVTPNLTQSADFSNTSWEGSVQYRFDAHKMIYVRYAEGFRGGGFIGLPSSVAVAQPYGPELSTNYEIGFKSEWLDRRLMLNLTLFNTQYEGLQRTLTEIDGGVVLQVVRNAADATTRGIELEFAYHVTDDFSIGGNFGYLDAFYDRYTNLTTGGATVDLSWQPFTFAPRYTAAIFAEYDFRIPGGLLGFNDLSWNSTYLWRDDYEIANTLVATGHQEAFGTLDMTFTLSDFQANDGLSLVIYGKNITDERFIDWGNNSGGVGDFVQDNIGRTFGAAIRYEF